ncbi:MAG: hypothetical protein IPM45_18135 [Acidimicrobiales bacterium]|nr:hypothetical protein [Acidimicrobiales bacterium]
MTFDKIGEGAAAHPMVLLAVVVAVCCALFAAAGDSPVNGWLLNLL